MPNAKILNDHLILVPTAGDYIPYLGAIIPRTLKAYGKEYGDFAAVPKNITQYAYAGFNFHFYELREKVSTDWVDDSIEFEDLNRLADLHGIDRNNIVECDIVTEADTPADAIVMAILHETANGGWLENRNA